MVRYGGQAFGLVGLGTLLRWGRLGCLPPSLERESEYGMRNKWAHVKPEVTQPCPDDNTTPFVVRQCAVWADNGVLVHPETAMEIAAWWQGYDDPAITAFASTGTIREGLKAEIEETIGLWERDLGRPRPVKANTDETRRDLMCLRALLAYVESVRV